MKFFKSKEDRVKLVGIRKYNRGRSDERKICEAEFSSKEEKYKDQLTIKDNKIAALQATLADVKTYINDNLGEYLHKLESVVYDMQYNNDVKRINTERIHQNVDSVSTKVLFESRRVRTKLKKTQDYVNKKVNEVAI